MPKVSTESVIVSVIKDKNMHINDKGNYRSICLSIIGSNIIDWMFTCKLHHISLGFVQACDRVVCVFAFKELLRFCTKHGSAMHVALLDASKAFDRVNRHKFITTWCT